MKKKLVVIGAGFGGYNVVKHLEKDRDISITLVDKCNHNVFQPMLYQVATGFIPITNVAIPLRSILKKETRFINDEVCDIDFVNKKVIGKSFSADYDYLVIALGSRYFYFGNKGWYRHTFSLKTSRDAIKMKNKILHMFELAEFEKNIDSKRKLLTFTIIGGGATGVEISGSISDLIGSDFLKKFNNIDKKDISIILIEAGDRLLASFNKKSSQKALENLAKKNVTIKLNESVTDIQKNFVTTNKSSYETSTIIWCAALVSAFNKIHTNLNKDKQGRLKVDKYLSISEYDNVYCIGDACCAYDETGEQYPGLASVAKQQGKFVSQDINSRLNNKKRVPFKYKDLGTMAIISKHSAIAEFKNKIFGSRFFYGAKGWFLWGFVHIYFILSIKNKFSIFFNWMTYYFFNRPSSLIIIQKNNKEDEKDN